MRKRPRRHPWPDDALEPERPNDGPEDAWSEPGSDELMDFEVLVRIRREAIEAELARERKIRRRAE
jgi:hypothetical protein